MIFIICPIILIIVAIACVLYFTSRYFFRFTILRKPTSTIDNNNVNANTNWKQHSDFIRTRRAWLAQQPTEEIYIKSFDNLKLHGTLLKSGNNRNCVICFHGYTSRALNDYGAMSKFYHEQNFNVLMPDARNHGDSEGKYTGFGVLDRYDAFKWIEYAVERFGKDVNIFLHGVSMGGATVLMTSGLDLPNNVKAIIADCAFTSAYDIFSYILKRDYHITKFPIMNITELMTRIKAGYGYKDVSTLDEVAKTKVPILFIHGDVDDFVPVWMTEKNYEACNSEKELLLIKGADHAEAYYIDKPAYENALKKMIEKYSR